MPIAVVLHCDEPTCPVMAAVDLQADYMAYWRAWSDGLTLDGSVYGVAGWALTEQDGRYGCLCPTHARRVAAA